MTTTLMTKTQAAWVLVAALVTLLVSILDNTIVTTTAVPITHALRPGNGAASVPWLLAAYALTSTVVQPLYGKLADAFGARDIYLIAVGLFVAGSVLCGLAQTMPELIIFRALQGLGGGGLMSLTMVIMGHLRAEDTSGRANRGNAIAALLVGIGLVCGPLVGGLIVRALDWRWVFFVNVPLGVAAFAVMAVCLRLPSPETRGNLELPSAGLLAVIASTLLIVCQWGGREVAWFSWQILVSATLGLVALVLFGLRQTRSADPFFPPRLLRQPTIRIVTLLQLASGCGMAAGIVYLTLELQLVRGASPIGTGLRMIPIGIGLGLGSWIGSLLVRRGRPLRSSITWGSVLAAAGLGSFALCGPTSPIVLLYALMILFGTGIGLGLGNEMLLIFAAVQRRDLGVATTGIRFAQTLGTSLGATLFATLFGAMVPVGASIDQVGAAIDVVFVIGAGLVGLSALIAMRLPAEATASGPGEQQVEQSVEQVPSQAASR
jgi:MFS family permease